MTEAEKKVKKIIEAVISENPELSPEQKAAQAILVMKLSHIKIGEGNCHD